MSENIEQNTYAAPITEAEMQFARHSLSRACSRGCTFLGSDYAILGGAMSWLSERNLVSAVSNAGGFGIIACGAMSPEMLEKEILATRALTQRPFGVNLITMHGQLSELIDVCVRTGVGHIVLAGGIPSAVAIKAAKSGGAKVIAFAPALVLAKRLIKMGVDALIIEGSEAGGHIGPVSLTVLAQEILPYIEEVPVFVAGGIGRGDAMVSYLDQGAAGAQLGTRFAAAQESIAHEKFKRAFVRAHARDALASTQLDAHFPVIPVRGLVNEGTKQFMVHQADVINRYQSGVVTREAAQLEIEHFWAGALRRAVIDGDVENGSVMAGQSVGLVTSVQPVSEIINDLVHQSLEAIVRRKRRMDSDA